MTLIMSKRQPGLGHYEINMARSCFKLLWIVVLKDMAVMLGFTSPKALSACKNAYDHHKAWQMLSIFLSGTSRELARPYVQECVNTNVHPSMPGFNAFLHRVIDPNFKFMHMVTFVHVFALFLFRCGVRKNNSEAMLGGRLEFSPLFYALTPPPPPWGRRGFKPRIRPPYPQRVVKGD